MTDRHWLAAIRRWDVRAARTVHAWRGRRRALDWAIAVLARGGAGLFFVAMGALLLFGGYRFSYAAAGVTTAVVAALATKLAIDGLAGRWKRGRPFLLLGFPPLVAKDPGDPSFPSNHAGGAFALAVCMAVYFPGAWGWGMLALACALSFSRLYAGLHFPSDLAAGAAIGAALALAACLVLG